MDHHIHCTILFVLFTHMVPLEDILVACTMDWTRWQSIIPMERDKIIISHKFDFVYWSIVCWTIITLFQNTFHTIKKLVLLTRSSTHCTIYSVICSWISVFAINHHLGSIVVKSIWYCSSWSWIRISIFYLLFHLFNQTRNLHTLVVLMNIVHLYEILTFTHNFIAITHQT